MLAQLDRAAITIARALKPMFIARLCCGVLSLGLALPLGYEAYWSWVLTLRGWGGNGLQLLGVSLSFPVGMTLLVLLTLAFGFGAIYAFFLARSDD
jgi:hypothetical protein